jgi:hypothetical protein
LPATAVSPELASFCTSSTAECRFAETGHSISLPQIPKIAMGDEGNRAHSCNYKGIAIFSARDNFSEIDVRGNGDIRVTGLVYALNGEFLAKGGGSSVDEWVVNGQLISRAARGDGNGSFVVTYNQNATYWLPPQLSLER